MHNLHQAVRKGMVGGVWCVLDAERGTQGTGVRRVQLDTLVTPRESTLVRVHLPPFPLPLPHIPLPLCPSPSFLPSCFSSGFFALPSLLSGPPGTPVPCARCQCNVNVDPLECEPIEGSCLRCLFNTSGRQCEMCAPGFYGDAITAKNCTGNVVLQTSKRTL